MPDTRSRSRLAILHYITEFSLQRYIGERIYPSSKQWSFTEERDAGLLPGDLVALSSAPASKWYLSWVISVQRPEGWCADQYTLESIEDGEIGNWHNVGLNVYNRQTVQEHPEWRWTDHEWALKDRWWRICYKKHDAYMYLPMYPVFNPNDYSVTFPVRVRLGLSDTVIRKGFVDWRKVTLDDLSETYLEAVRLFKAEKELVE